MSLDHGGHLTHGAKVNFSGKVYNSVLYGVDSEGIADYGQIAELAAEHKPKMIIAGILGLFPNHGLGTFPSDR